MTPVSTTLIKGDRPPRPKLRKAVSFDVAESNRCDGKLNYRLNARRSSVYQVVQKSKGVVLHYIEQEAVCMSCILLILNLV